MRRITTKHIKKGIKIGLFLIASGALISGIIIFRIIQTLPSPQLLENRRTAETTKIYDRTGEILLYEIYGDEKRTIIPFEEIPDSVKQATILLEDAGFYEHPAFEWKSILRAFIVNIKRGEVVQGGSTITQQLAKKAFLSDERTITRKLKELILAFQLERRFTKDEILSLYLNQIPYGSNAFGIESASQIFFGKHAKELSIAEAALLASIPKATTYYSPWGSNLKQLITRRDYAIQQMALAGYITEEEQEAALASVPEFEKPFQGIKAPHFVMSVQEYLNEKYGEDFVRTNGLSVITTLDMRLQEIAEQVIEAGVKRNEELYEGKNGALVAQDGATGQILALVGSRDYFDVERDGNFNVATQGLRQPGSAMKPFIYAAGFEKGLTPDTILFDLETEFDATGNPEKSYKPGNYDEKFRGPMTIRDALAQSVNIPAVKTLYLVGLGDALKTAQKFGLTTLKEKSRYGLSLVLGGGEVRLIDLVGGYSVFAEDGIKHRQTFILKVSTKDRVLEEFQEESDRVMDAQYVRLINDVLSDQEARAPLFGNSLLIPSLPDYQIAVKTGTSNDYRDAWTVGYTPKLIVGVWAGNNDNAPMIRKGGSIFAAAPMWRDFMAGALPFMTPDSFVSPDPIFTNKPMLNGSYIVTYKYQNQLYPHIHEILYYVDKDDISGPSPKNPQSDPQFQNWESPVVVWAEKNIPNFSAFNQLIPAESEIIGDDSIQLTPGVSLSLTKPQSGDFISPNGIISIAADISSNKPITQIELFWNNIRIATTVNPSLINGISRYAYTFIPQEINLQNLLKITVSTDEGVRAMQEVILFKKP
jgi:1A family penicillin-binding protein